MYFPLMVPHPCLNLLSPSIPLSLPSTPCPGPLISCLPLQLFTYIIFCLLNVPCNGSTPLSSPLTPLSLSYILCKGSPLLSSFFIPLSLSYVLCQGSSPLYNLTPPLSLTSAPCPDSPRLSNTVTLRVLPSVLGHVPSPA